MRGGFFFCFVCKLVVIGRDRFITSQISEELVEKMQSVLHFLHFLFTRGSDSDDRTMTASTQLPVSQ